MSEDVYEVLSACVRYIETVGGNYTSQGLPHPQQLLLDQAYNVLEKQGKNVSFGEDNEMTMRDAND